MQPNPWRRRLVRAGWIALGLVLLVAAVIGGVWWYYHPDHTRADAIVYGRRNGRDLTMDVVRPSAPNGLGVALMVSGGWKSGRTGFKPWMVAPLLRRGYTVFAISHVSQPQATIMDIVEDMHRGIRFIRHHAKEQGIDPQRLGVTGGSAGGHLSLMLATRGGPGPADARDPVDRESSAVQAVAIFYPVTDLLNLGKSTENPGDGGPPKSYVKGFGAAATNRELWRLVGREISPVYHVTTNLPPVLILHGDADTLTPLEQSLWFQERARAVGRTVELEVHPGGKHGWPTMILDVRKLAAWFDRHLRP